MWQHMTWLDHIHTAEIFWKCFCNGWEILSEYYVHVHVKLQKVFEIPEASNWCSCNLIKNTQKNVISLQITFLFWIKLQIASY